MIRGRAHLRDRYVCREDLGGCGAPAGTPCHSMTTGKQIGQYHEARWKQHRRAEQAREAGPDPELVALRWLYVQTRELVMEWRKEAQDLASRGKRQALTGEVVNDCADDLAGLLSSTGLDLPPEAWAAEAHRQLRQVGQLLATAGSRDGPNRVA